MLRLARRRALRLLARVLPAAALSRVWHNPLFDARWYMDQYPDVAAARRGVEYHYRRHGAVEGRNPNAVFDTRWYVSSYPDVATSRLNPLDHYYLFGLAEGRAASPELDSDDAADTRPPLAPEVTTPARFPYLFIVAYGRSGSTLLQAIINTLPGYRIRGENGGVLGHFRDLLSLTAHVQQTFAATNREPSDPWFGIDLVDRARLVEDLARLFVAHWLQPEPHDRCVGFKEIRYGPDQDLSAYLDFVEEMFPRACFVFNVRDVAAAARSGFWQDRADAFDVLTRSRTSMELTYARGKENYFWVDYDEYTKNPDRLRLLFDFLGELYDDGAIRDVLARQYSSVPTEVPSP